MVDVSLATKQTKIKIEGLLEKSLKIKSTIKIMENHSKAWKTP